VYVPAPFAVGDEEAWDLLSASRLGALVTHGPEGLNATHLPFVVDRAGGLLLGHIARANPHGVAGEGEALVIFQGVDAYVSPSFYATKAEHGRVVPTWNYEAVHVRGLLTWFDDLDQLLDVVDRLSARFEAARPAPWSVADAPPAYIERLLGAIVGVKVEVTSVVGVRKLSQNQPAPNHAGVVAGLQAGALSERETALAMAPATA
jgi:transcriptional regulator